MQSSNSDDGSSRASPAWPPLVSGMRSVFPPLWPVPLVCWLSIPPYSPMSTSTAT